MTPSTSRSCSRCRPTTTGRWAVRMTAVGVLSSLALNASVPDGNAAIFQPAPPTPFATQVAEKRGKTPPPAETYQKRQERIGKTKRPLLPALAENKSEDTTCVSAEFTTLSVIYDSIVGALLPSLPADARAAVTAHQRDAQAWMRTGHVSTLAVSDHPNTRGTDADDPDYRSPISQLVVNNLLKIRDGEQNDAIPVGNITLSQAVESVWLYVFAGILSPAKFAVAMAPTITAVDWLTTVLRIAVSGSSMALQYLYKGTSNAILNQCVAQVTDEQKAQAGKPSEQVRYDIPIHPLIQGAADQIALADSDTCKPIGDASLGRILQRTSDYAKSLAPDAATKRQIDAQTRALAGHMKNVRVPHNLIPADPADWSTAESMMSTMGSVLLGFAPEMVGGLGGLLDGAVAPTTGVLPSAILAPLEYLDLLAGAPLDILIGLGHNAAQGDNLAETVSLHDLTVTKSLTATYYTYYFATHLVTALPAKFAEDNIVTYAIPGVDGVTVTPFKMLGAVLDLPLTYGLVTFHHAVRSLCFVEDDLTGTGLGAEANKKDPEAHASAVAEKKAAEKKAAARKAAARKAQKEKERKAREEKAKNGIQIGGVTLPSFP